MIPPIPAIPLRRRTGIRRTDALETASRDANACSRLMLLVQRQLLLFTGRVLSEYRQAHLS